MSTRKEKNPFMTNKSAVSYTLPELRKRAELVCYDVFLTVRGRLLSLSRESRRVRLLQKNYLQENYRRDAKKIIVFLTPGRDIANGGIFWISSLFEESRRLMIMNDVEIMLCPYPGDPPLLRYTKFKNENTLVNFSDVLEYFDNLECLLLFVSAHNVRRFLWTISLNDRKKIAKIPKVSINVLIGNIETLPCAKTIHKLSAFGNLTAAATAHSKYCTLKLRRELGFPLHQLSTCISPEQYYHRKYAQKENLMILSPDPHPRRDDVISILKKNIPQLQIRVIQNLTFEQYKQLISKAKWALTFGEGLDGYFIETIFSGGVSFSVYNKKFFTEDFGSLRTVYENYEILAEKICKDIVELDDEKAYTDYQNKQFELCNKHYDYENYLKNLEAFYKGEYSYK